MRWLFVTLILMRFVDFSFGFCHGLNQRVCVWCVVLLSGMEPPLLCAHRRPQARLHRGARRLLVE